MRLVRKKAGLYFGQARLIDGSGEWIVFKIERDSNQPRGWEWGIVIGHASSTRTYCFPTLRQAKEGLQDCTSSVNHALRVASKGGF